MLSNKQVSYLLKEDFTENNKLLDFFAEQNASEKLY